jgi:hypothetical protein
MPWIKRPYGDQATINARGRGRDAADCGLAQTAGVSEYAPRFVEIGIDFRSLPDPTDQYLEKLGKTTSRRPTSLGSREECRADRTIDLMAKLSS